MATAAAETTEQGGLLVEQGGMDASAAADEMQDRMYGRMGANTNIQEEEGEGESGDEQQHDEEGEVVDEGHDEGQHSADVAPVAPAAAPPPPAAAPPPPPPPPEPVPLPQAPPMAVPQPPPTSVEPSAESSGQQRGSGIPSAPPHTTSPRASNGLWNQSPSRSNSTAANQSPSRRTSTAAFGRTSNTSARRGSGDVGSNNAAGGGMRGRARPKPIVSTNGAESKISSPTAAERAQRREWAQVQQRRKAEIAQRLQADQVQVQQERQQRMEERRAAVRKRIESEKQSLRAAAEERAAKLAGLDVPPPAPGIKGRRNPSPRPLYLRLQDDYEARKAAEEEETRKKLDELAAAKRARVAALVSGEVVIKPPEGVIRAKDKESPPRWNPSFKGHNPNAVSMKNSFSSQPSGNLFKDIPERQNSQYTQENGMVLYSLHEGQQGEEGASPDGHKSGHFLPGAGGPRNGGTRIVPRRSDQHGLSGRFSGAKQSRVMTERACSPIVLDPVTQQPINVPPQETFWNRNEVSSPTRAIRQPSHLSEFSMPVKLREMGPAASNAGTSASPPMQPKSGGLSAAPSDDVGVPAAAAAAGVQASAAGQEGEEPWKNEDDDDSGSLPDADMLAKMDEELQGEDEEEGGGDEGEKGGKGDEEGNAEEKNAGGEIKGGQ